MPPPCIVCDHDSGSPEHLWPDWMHNTITFAPINMWEADGPVITGQDPEQTIITVCSKCNNGWMSLIENKACTRPKPTLLNQPIEIDRGGMKLLTDWVVLRAMDFESIKPKTGNEQFFTREERIAFKENQTIPERTRVWVGALENSHIGYHGTDYAIWKSAADHTRIGTGSVATIHAGHIIMQTVTEHIHPPYVVQPGPVISPLPGPADERFVEIYPNQPKRINCRWQRKKGPFWQDCGPASAGSNHFRHFPAQRAGRFAFVLFLAAELACGQAAGALTCQPGDVSAAINQWQSGPCGPPLWPLRALPPTDKLADQTIHR